MPAGHYIHHNDLKNLPVLHPTLMEIAWAAGIYEGEGCASVIKLRSNNCTMSVIITQKDRWLLDKMRDLFGGYVFYTIKRDYWTLTISGPTARGFLMTIFKFMSPRRKDQITKAFHMVDSLPTHYYDAEIEKLELELTRR